MENNREKCAMFIESVQKDVSCRHHGRDLTDAVDDLRLVSEEASHSLTRDCEQELLRYAEENEGSYFPFVLQGS